MDTIHNYKDLQVWQNSYKLVKDISQINSQFPDNKKFGLTLQICRAATSIPSKIVKRCLRKITKDYIRFGFTSIDSSPEVETKLVLAVNLVFIAENITNTLFENTTILQKILHRLRHKLRDNTPNTHSLIPTPYPYVQPS